MIPGARRPTPGPLHPRVAEGRRQFGEFRRRSSCQPFPIKSVTNAVKSKYLVMHVFIECLKCVSQLFRLQLVVDENVFEFWDHSIEDSSGYLFKMAISYVMKRLIFIIICCLIFDFKTDNY